MSALQLGLQRLVAHRPHLAKVLQNIAWLSLDQALRMVLGLAVGLWLARYLGPQQFGQLNYALAFVGLFAAVGGLGLQSVVVREIVRGKQEAAVVLGSAAALQLAAGLAALLLALLAGLVFSADDALLRTSIVLLSITLPLRASDSVRYWFEAKVESRYVVWVENGAFLLTAAARIALILAGAGLIAFVLMSLLEVVLVSLGLLWSYSRRVGALSRWRTDRATMRSLFMDSWPYLFAALAVTLYMRMDIVMLQQMASSYEVGVYSAAAKLSELLYVLPSIFVASVSPALIESHQSNRPLHVARMRQLYAAGFWFAAVLSALVCVFARPLVGLSFGPGYADAAAVLAIHVWGSIAVVHGIASSQHLLVENLQKVSLYRTLIGLACNFALNAAWIPHYGAQGAAWATVIAYYVATYSLALFGSTRGHVLFMLAGPFTRRRPL